MTSLHERTWRAEYESAQKALVDWVFQDDDGNQWVSHAAPVRLQELLSNLTSIGYANGWL